VKEEEREKGENRANAGSRRGASIREQVAAEERPRPTTVAWLGPWARRVMTISAGAMCAPRSTRHLQSSAALHPLPIEAGRNARH
jgi:hypothetical protein